MCKLYLTLFFVFLSATTALHKPPREVAAKFIEKSRESMVQHYEKKINKRFLKNTKTRPP